MERNIRVKIKITQPANPFPGHCQYYYLAKTSLDAETIIDFPAYFSPIPRQISQEKTDARRRRKNRGFIY